MFKILGLSLLLIMSSCSQRASTNNNIAEPNEIAVYDDSDDNSINNLDDTEDCSKPLSKIFYLQLGSFKTLYFANQLMKKLTKMGYITKNYSIIKNNIKFTVVETGPFSSKKIALKHRKILIDRLDLSETPLIKKRNQ